MTVTLKDLERAAEKGISWFDRREVAKQRRHERKLAKIEKDSRGGDDRMIQTCVRWISGSLASLLIVTVVLVTRHDTAASRYQNSTTKACEVAAAQQRVIADCSIHNVLGNTHR